MSHLLDSDITIYYINGDEAARQFVRQLAPAGIAISTITLMEVLAGVAVSPRPLVARDRIEAIARTVPVLPFGEAEARRCATIRRSLQQQGWRVRSRMLDLMIAATAIEHGLAVATNNPIDYRNIPNLQVVTL